MTDLGLAAPAPPARAPAGRGLILCLHLGAHKTATTLIQRRLAALRGRIGGRPFLYRSNEDVKAAPWARWCRGKPDAADPVRAFAEEVAAWRGGRGGIVVVSSEDFLGSTALFDGRGLYPEAADRLGRLAELLGTQTDIDLRPLFHIRRTPAFLASALSQEIAKGRTVDRRTLRRTLRAELFRWREVVSAIETMLGRPVAVRRYEAIETHGGRAYVLDALAAFGLPEPTARERLLALGGLAERIPKPLARLVHEMQVLARPNAALSTRGVAIADAIRPHVDAAEWDRIVRPFLARHFNAVRDQGRSIRLDSDLAEALDCEYERDLAALAGALVTAHPAIPGAVR